MNKQTKQPIYLLTLAFALLGLILAAGLAVIFVRLDRIEKAISCQEHEGRGVVCIHVVTRGEVNK